LSNTVTSGVSSLYAFYGEDGGTGGNYQIGGLGGSGYGFLNCEIIPGQRGFAGGETNSAQDGNYTYTAGGGIYGGLGGENNGDTYGPGGGMGGGPAGGRGGNGGNQTNMLAGYDGCNGGYGCGGGGGGGAIQGDQPAAGGNRGLAGPPLVIFEFL
jgi:hypothetical protein